MMRSRRVAASLIAIATAIAIASCGATEVVRVDLGTEVFDFGVVAVVDDRGVVTRLSDRFAVRGGMVEGALPTFPLEAGESDFVVVALTYDGLRGAIPSFDRVRASELSLSIAQPPAAPLLVSVGGQHGFDTALPSNARVLSGSPLVSTTAGLSQLTLRVPIDPEFCRGPTSTMVPFGGMQDLLPSRPEDAKQVNHAVIIDDDTVIIAEDFAIHRVERDRGVVSSTAAADRYGGRRMLYIEASNELIVATGRTDPTFWHTSVEAGDGLGRVRTSSVVGAAVGVRAMVLDADSNIIAVGRNGGVMTRVAGESVFRMQRGPPTDTNLRNIVFTGDPVDPHLVTGGETATSALVFVGDALAGRWRPVTVAVAKEFDGLSVAPDGRIWGSGARNQLVVGGVGRPWESVPLCIPPRAAECAVPGSPEGFCGLPGDLDDVLVDGTHAYVLHERCSAAFRMRLSDGCVSVLSRGDERIGITEFENQKLIADDRRLFMVSEHGGLFVIDR